MKHEIKFVKVLKELMDRDKVSQKELSSACGLPQSTLASYLAGIKESYSPKHLLSIADYFQVSIDYLLSRREGPQKSLNSHPVEKVFDGWLKVKIEKLVENKTRNDNDE